jgi:ZIP family zinc transporter
MSGIVDVLVLSCLAGLATGLGGLVVFFRSPSKRFLGFLLGLAAGIMITLSFLELMVEALRISTVVWASAAFAAGALVMFLLDFVLPHRHFAVDEKGIIDGRLLRSGVLMAIGISIHNFPEGIAVAAGYSYIPDLGVVIAVAMALHNIPEGMAISLPMCCGGASRWTGFKWALVSGLVEPLGALVSAVFLQSFAGLAPFGLAFAGGVMVFVTLDELIPVAHEQGHEHFTSAGIIMGCIATFALLAMLKQ